MPGIDGAKGFPGRRGPPGLQGNFKKDNKVRVILDFSYLEGKYAFFANIS